MASDDYIHTRVGDDYEKIIQQDGVRTTICKNRYEILLTPTAELSEQQAMQQIREWIRWRNEKILRDAGAVPE